MEHSIFKEATSKNILSYVYKRAFRKWYWQDLFPLKSHPFLSYEALIGAEGAPVAADVVAYNTSAPEKTRDVISSVKGDIPAIRVKRSMKEKDINDYNIIKALGTPASDPALLDLVFGDIDFVINGVNARLEWLALKLLSNGGKLQLRKATNAGIVTETNIDYGMTSSYKNGAAVVWSAGHTTTTPITDIEAIVTKAILRGITLKYILMHRTAWGYFRVSDETANFLVPYSIAGIIGKRINPTINLAMVNKAMIDNQFPQIIIVDQSINTETEDHVRTAANPFTAETVVFLPELAIGNTLHGPIAEETNPPKQVEQAKSGHILVSKWRNVDPTCEYTKGEANAFPIWPLIDQCYVLDTEHASSWTDPSTLY